MDKNKQHINHYESWLKSGLTRKEYSKQAGISKETIYYWQRKTNGSQSNYRQNPSTKITKNETSESWLTLPIQDEIAMFSFQTKLEFSITKEWEIIFKVRFV